VTAVLINPRLASSLGLVKIAYSALHFPDLHLIAAGRGCLPIQRIHTFLVHVGKGVDTEPEIGGTSVPLSGKLFVLLESIYSKSEQECDIDIAFRPSASGAQRNPCRDLILGYLDDCTLDNGRLLATRLEEMTDGRSGLGLLFLIFGKEGRDHKIIISRFPTDTAILADEKRRSLTVEFLERVFMKSATSYKAVLYRDSSLQSGFWTGKAVDRQINNRNISLSNYWISDFLGSDFSVTPAAGTRRLAIALQNAAKRSGLDVKTEIIAAVTLAGSLRGKRTSITEFEQRFALSADARAAIRKELKSPRLADERFQFDRDEFDALVGYRSVELDNGAMMTAQSSEFDQVFHPEVIDETNREVRFSTEGRIVNQKLKKTL
jgi:hypothetical protein